MNIIFKFFFHPFIPFFCAFVFIVKILLIFSFCFFFSSVADGRIVFVEFLQKNLCVFLFSNKYESAERKEEVEEEGESKKSTRYNKVLSIPEHCVDGGDAL